MVDLKMAIRVWISVQMSRTINALDCHSTLSIISLSQVEENTQKIFRKEKIYLTVKAAILLIRTVW